MFTFKTFQLFKLGYSSFKFALDLKMNDVKRWKLYIVSIKAPEE